MSRPHGILWTLAIRKTRLTPSEVWLNERLIEPLKMGNISYNTQLIFFEWAKQDTSAIELFFVSIEDCEISERFLKATCENLQAVKGAMKVHAVFTLKANSIWVRDTSCFCKYCFSLKFQKDSCFKGW